MSELRRQEIARLLEHCDFRLAGRELVRGFSCQVVSPQVSQLMNEFLGHPSVDTAVDLVLAQPALLGLFAACTPGGALNRPH
ncbi:MAG: hypothetical protein QHH05_01540 [Syntrophomonadaceae bacterium]|nr:hypothetical protein [Syntrophomonadaceae bacterium]